MRHTLICALALLAGAAHAQDILIRDAAVHTAADAGVIENGDVLIRDGKIAAVGDAIDAPANATIVEAKGRALTPGLFGGLSGIGIEEVSLEPSTVDATLQWLAPPYEMQWRPEFDVTLAYNPRSVLVPVARIEGLTWTMLAPGSVEGGNFLAGQGGAVSLDGRFDALLPASRALFIHIGGDANSISAGSRAAQWMLLEQAIREARAKTQPDGETLLHPAGREALARYLNGGRVLFRVARASDIRRVLEFSRRHGFKPVIVGGEEAWVVASELAEADVPVLLDALANLPVTFDAIGARLDNAALLHRAGVRISFTQFGQSHNARKIRQLAGNAVAHGLPRDAALAGLTSTPAGIFGLSNRGRIAVGQVADVVLWSGDPLEVTSVAEQVWINGRPIEMRSRQTELRDRYLPRTSR